MTTQGTRQEESSAMYTRTPVDWERRIVLLTPSGVERDGGPIIPGGATPERDTSASTISDTLVSAGYDPWFTLPGLAVFTGDDAPQTHAYCASLAIGGTIRVLAFETLSALSACVATWVPILDAVEDSYSGA
jgi:hypothetical protein